MSEELVLNQPELSLLREMKIYYPPISLILYSVEPYANPETLFLYLILSRSEFEPDKDIFAGTYYMDFNALTTASAIPSPLVYKFRNLITESPNVHFRSYESAEEFLRAIDLYYRSSNHLYLFVPYLKENERDLPEKLGLLVKKIKLTGRKSATLSIFLDSFIFSSPASRLLHYYSDAIFSLRMNEKTGKRELALNRLSFSSLPLSPLELSIESDGVRFQMVRSY
ncbi:MAG: hypothetical protein ACP5GN_04585 [Fervidicoccaceae archaeon]